MIMKRNFFQYLVVSIFLLSLSISHGSFMVNTDKYSPNFRSTASQSRTDKWIEDLQKNYDNPSWFFTNLNDHDRLLIREAIDYAIPRDQIINTILNGFGTKLATYQLPETGIFFNPSVTVKPYNLTMASQLLAEVFGYTYASSNNPNTPYNESKPYFPLYIMKSISAVPTSMWSSPIHNALETIGINVSIIEVNFGSLIDRVFPTNQSILGLDYQHGGYDGVLIGWEGSLLLDTGANWYDSSFIPNSNYQIVNSTNLDRIIAKEEKSSLTFQQRLDYY